MAESAALVKSRGREWSGRCRPRTLHKVVGHCVVLGALRGGRVVGALKASLAMMEAVEVGVDHVHFVVGGGGLGRVPLSARIRGQRAEGVGSVGERVQLLLACGRERGPCLIAQVAVQGSIQTRNLLAVVVLQRWVIAV